MTSKFGLGVQNEAGQRLTEFCQENTLVIANTLFLQHKRRLYTWRRSKTRLGASCGSDHKLLIAKFRLKLKKVGKTTRPFRYDLNQIPYDDTVEVTDRFKALDLIDRVP